MDIVFGPDGKILDTTDHEFPYELDEDGNWVRKDRIKPFELGSNLHKLIDLQIDEQVVEDILQKTIDHYWEENCEGEVPPNIEVVEVSEDGMTITFVVHEEEPWNFTVPI